MFIPASGSEIAPRQSGPHVWKSHDVGHPDVWTWRLSNDEVSELLAASAPFVDGDEQDLAGITAEMFPLPSLGGSLLRLRRRVTHGRGFEVIRGFPSDDVSEQQSAAVFAGIGAHLGSLRPQNAAGDLLGHVRNVGADPTDPNVRIYQTSRRQTFHTDSTDVVGLLCLETAAQGGDSLLVSAAALYNEILDRDPTLAALLFLPVATDRRGEVPEGCDPYFMIPVLTWFDESLTVLYQRQYIESAQRFEDAPPLTSEVIKALDLFDEVANSASFHIRMRLEVGDMQFVHNHVLLHDRTGFIDKPNSPRHLLRLWLSVPDDRELPPIFAQRYGTTTVGDRGGIQAVGGDQKFSADLRADKPE